MLSQKIDVLVIASSHSMTQPEVVEKAKEHFGKLIEQQLRYVEAMKAGADWVDYSKLKPIVVG